MHIHLRPFIQTITFWGQSTQKIKAFSQAEEETGETSLPALGAEGTGFLILEEPWIGSRTPGGNDHVASPKVSVAQEHHGQHDWLHHETLGTPLCSSVTWGPRATCSDPSWHDRRPSDPQSCGAGTRDNGSWSQKLTGTIETKVIYTMDLILIHRRLSKYYL